MKKDNKFPIFLNRCDFCDKEDAIVIFCKICKRKGCLDCVDVISRKCHQCLEKENKEKIKLN